MNREAWHAAIHGVSKVGHDWATEMNWTELCCLLPPGLLYLTERHSFLLSNFFFFLLTAKLTPASVSLPLEVFSIPLKPSHYILTLPPWAMREALSSHKSHLICSTQAVRMGLWDLRATAKFQGNQGNQTWPSNGFWVLSVNDLFVEG